MSNKADEECKRILKMILNDGCVDKNPRPKWPSDGKVAHTISINGVMSQYNIANGEHPFLTLRPVAIKTAIKELFWIYQDASNDLNVLEEKYGVHYWNDWDIGDRTIGACYGETVRRHNLMHNLLDDIEKDPDGRRHIINLWQEDDFKDLHGLKPCVFLSNFNIRYDRNLDKYLDLTIYQRSCDYITAGCTINQAQYYILQCMVAAHVGAIPGVFTWFCNNVQIYDRHIEAAIEMISREPVECSPVVSLNSKTNFWEMTPDDIKIIGYPREIIQKQNPQIKLEVAV